MSAVSLTSLLRLTDYVAFTAKSTAARGWEREYVKPLCKQLAGIFERILGGSLTIPSTFLTPPLSLGNKITVTPTNILLMAIVIVLFAILLTLGEKNEKEKKSSKEKKN